MTVAPGDLDGAAGLGFYEDAKPACVAPAAPAAPAGLAEANEESAVVADVQPAKQHACKQEMIRSFLLQHTWCQLATMAKEAGDIDELDLMGTACMSCRDCEDFANFLAEDKYFKAIDLCHCMLSNNFAAIIGAGMCYNGSITSFGVGGNRLGDECCEAMGKLLQSNNVLSELDLSGNEIGEEGARLLALGLAGNCGALTQLDLGGNSIGDNGAKACAEMLESVHESFRHLDLVHNNITAVGAHHLAGAIEKRKNLEILRLNSNCIGDDGALHFAAAIRHNPHACALDLCDNNITAMGKGYLQAASDATGRSMEVTTLQLNPLTAPKNPLPERSPDVPMEKRCRLSVAFMLRGIRCGRRRRPFAPLADQIARTDEERFLQESLLV